MFFGKNDPAPEADSGEKKVKAESYFAIVHGSYPYSTRELNVFHTAVLKSSGSWLCVSQKVRFRDTHNISVTGTKSVLGPGFYSTYGRFILQKWDQKWSAGTVFLNTPITFSRIPPHRCFEPENKGVLRTTCGRSRRGALGQRPKKPIGSAANTLLTEGYQPNWTDRSRHSRWVVAVSGRLR